MYYSEVCWNQPQTIFRLQSNVGPTQKERKAGTATWKDLFSTSDNFYVHNSSPQNISNSSPAIRREVWYFSVLLLPTLNSPISSHSSPPEGFVCATTVQMIIKYVFSLMNNPSDISARGVLCMLCVLIPVFIYFFSALGVIISLQLFEFSTSPSLIHLDQVTGVGAWNNLVWSVCQGENIYTNARCALINWCRTITPHCSFVLNITETKTGPNHTSEAWMQTFYLPVQ